MSIYSIKTINLGKQEDDSDYWVSDVNDNKMQEIATAINAKINIVIPGSKWILYKGDDSHNTTGWEFSIENERVYIRPIINNVRPSSIDNSKYVVLTRNNRSDIDCAKTAEFHYVNCKDGDVVFGISAILSSTSSIEDLYFRILSGKNIKDNSNRIIYAFSGNKPKLYTDVSTEAEVDQTQISIGIQNDFIVLAQFAIPKLYIVCENVYWPLFGKDVTYNLSNYGFELNGKKYFVPNSDTTLQRIVLELPDSTS